MLVGIDEVGRGPIAGPLLVCAVGFDAVLNEDDIPELKDSKALKPWQRREKSVQIKYHAATISVAWASERKIDEIGLGKCLRSCFESVALQTLSQVRPATKIDFIVDGKVDYLSSLDLSSSAIVKADEKYPEVSAASIAAKVMRDDYMAALAHVLPGYSFETNSGYGTRSHMAAVRKVGPSWVHRTSFLDKALNPDEAK